MKNKGLKASSLRASMIFLIITLIVVSGAGFYYVQDMFFKKADEISKTSINSSQNDSSSSQALKQVRDEIASYQPLADKATSITVTNNFKDKVTSDLKKYASQSGVVITNYNSDSPTKPSTPTIIGGITTGHITITIENPVSIEKLLKFFKYIETNAPKMQITGIDITRIDSSQDQVNIKPITIEVYVK